MKKTVPDMPIMAKLAIESTDVLTSIRIAEAAGATAAGLPPDGKASILIWTGEPLRQDQAQVMAEPRRHRWFAILSQKQERQDVRSRCTAAAESSTMTGSKNPYVRKSGSAVWWHWLGSGGVGAG